MKKGNLEKAVVELSIRMNKICRELDDIREDKNELYDLYKELDDILQDDDVVRMKEAIKKYNVIEIIKADELVELMNQWVKIHCTFAPVDETVLKKMFQEPINTYENIAKNLGERLIN